MLGSQPSLLRITKNLTRTEVLALEKRAIEKFMAQAHLHLPSSWLPPAFPAACIAEWWPLMQHYSAPTRLLDWTYSIYAAAYFAVSNHWERDGALYLVHGNRLGEEMNRRHGSQASFTNGDFASAHPVQRLVAWTPTRQMDRLVAQQGIFTVSLDILADHGTLIEEILQPTVGGSEITYQKLRVPAALKPALMLHLRYMNIAAHSLFQAQMASVGRSPISSV